MKIASATTIVLAALLAAGCTAKRIPGLAIALADTPENRAIVKLMDDYRDAYEHKDIDKIVAMASKKFYEDSGTPETSDDYAFDGLKEHFGEHFKHLKKVQLNIQLRKVKIKGDKAKVDYRYITRYLMDLPSGEKWQVTDELNRMDLVKEKGEWKVISGF